MEAARAKGLHPYAWYLGGAVAALGLGYALAGLAGVFVWAALALHAQVQLMLSDYVQHYGLMRRTRDDGGLEPAQTAEGRLGAQDGRHR